MRHIFIVLRFLLYSFINIIEFFEYFFIKFLSPDHIIESYHIAGIDVLSNNGYVPLQMMHLTIPHREYRVYCDDGTYIGGADDHPIVTNNGIKKISELREGDYVKTIDVVRKVKKVKKMFLPKISMCDVTVKSDNRLYYANGVLVHNCVTFDAEITVFDSAISEQFIKIPIFELYYKYKKRMKFLDKVELSLFRILYRLRKRMDKDKRK